MATLNEAGLKWMRAVGRSEAHRLALIAVVECGGRLAESGTFGCYSPGWSPDGDRIVFTRSDGSTAVGASEQTSCVGRVRAVCLTA